MALRSRYPGSPIGKTRTIDGLHIQQWNTLEGFFQGGFLPFVKSRFRSRFAIHEGWDRVPGTGSLRQLPFGPGFPHRSDSPPKRPLHRLRHDSGRSPASRAVRPIQGSSAQHRARHIRQSIGDAARRPMPDGVAKPLLATLRRFTAIPLPEYRVPARPRRWRAGSGSPPL